MFYSDTIDGKSTSKMLSISRSENIKFKQSNFGNKNRRVKEDGGKGARNFKLSFIFVFLIFLSLITSTVIFVIDYITYVDTENFINVEKAIRAEILAMKSASVSFLVIFLIKDKSRLISLTRIIMMKSSSIWYIKVISSKRRRFMIFHSEILRICTTMCFIRIPVCFYLTKK